MDLNDKHIFEVDLNNQDNTNTLNVANLGKVEDFEKDIVEPKNFLGFYSNLIESVLSEHGIETKVNIAYEEEITSDGSTLSIYLQKGALTPYGLNAPGTTFKPVSNISVEGIPGINPHETLRGCDLFSQDMTIHIFSANRAEIERVSYIIFLLLMATSDDVLDVAFDKIVKVDPPTMAPITALSQNNNYYNTELEWKISFIDSNVLLFRKKMVKFTRLIVRDKQAKEELKGQYND